MDREEKEGGDNQLPDFILFVPFFSWPYHVLKRASCSTGMTTTGVCFSGWVSCANV